MIARDNPFAPSRLEKVLAFDPALIGTTWENLDTLWLQHGQRAAITGHKGSGKTSLLQAWGLRLEAAGRPTARLFFNLERNRLDASDREILRTCTCTGRILLVDGDCHLPWLQRRELRRASRAAAGVLLARHQPGPWPVLIRLQPDLRLAETLLRRAAPQFASHLQASLHQKLGNHRGNLRELWLDYYAQLSEA
ncbi:hypothetical protein OJ996_03035 [Luteolibacter sp. GHJ8]|uniref:Uncharacterized protein n=1 Tax=Luteolibacter rhizosphaerae TaxID=2989719 RepID=A0ABT3FY82_9BACT|nr:hypothetical protein [Luteolibacter rhizosphaerae]MCW1912532.1 hypothetical protein [Luteolibacter rhizosphaerae]